ncbi:MAG: retroviral-like aspartic protease [Ignavibacteriae bacterium]|nr:retroviral-like aspartic protease [Ignavibacteriota bacterium]
MAVIQKNILLEGTKGKEETTALFDSGTSYSCINPKIASRLEQVLRLPKPLDFGPAKNGETLHASEVVRLDFYIGEYRFSDEFMVIPDLLEPIIIGAATLQKWRMKLDFEADDVIIDPRVTKLRLM